MAARELTEKEKKRQALVEKTIQAKEADGYKRVDLTTSKKKANTMALVYGGIICVPAMIIHSIVYGYHYESLGMIAAIVVMLVLVVVHELIHGAVWGLFAKDHYKSIEFGIIAKALMPYCTCLEPITKVQYMLGSMMPGVLLGIIPLIISFINGSTTLMLIGSALTLAAGGDMTVLVDLLKHKSDKKEMLCVDHPTEVGLIVLEK